MGSPDLTSDVLAEVNRLRAVLEEIRHLHTDSPAGPCPSCGRVYLAPNDDDDGLVDYPCPTLRAMGITGRSIVEPSGGQ